MMSNDVKAYLVTCFRWPIPCCKQHTDTVTYHKNYRRKRYFTSKYKNRYLDFGFTQRGATATLWIASLPLPLFVKFINGATAAVPEQK